MLCKSYWTEMTSCLGVIMCALQAMHEMSQLQSVSTLSLLFCNNTKYTLLKIEILLKYLCNV